MKPNWLDSLSTNVLACLGLNFPNSVGNTVLLNIDYSDRTATGAHEI